MRRLHLLTIVCAAVWSACLFGGLAHAQMPDNVTLAVTPATVTLAPDESVEILVVATVPITTAQRISLTTYSDTNIQVAVESGPPANAPVRGDLAWRLRVTRPAKDARGGKIFLRADYAARAEDGVEVSGIATATLEVTTRAVDQVDEVFTATLETTLDTTFDRKEREVYVIVKNIANVPITISEISAEPIRNFEITPLEARPQVVIAAQSAHTFSMTLKAMNAVEPIRQLLVVRVNAEWDQEARHHTGGVVLTKAFDVNVFGESEILAATQIPALLFLPGFLFLAMLLLVVRWGWKKSGGELDFKKPGFWLFAITLSFIALFVYPLITGPLVGRLFNTTLSAGDFFGSYGFLDIVYMWIGSIGLALLLGVLLVGLYWLSIAAMAGARRVSAWRKRSEYALRVPTADDMPMTTLRKIANNQSGFKLRRVKYPKGAADAEIAFVLPSGFPEEGKIWVAPHIKPLWNKAHLAWAQDHGALQDELSTLKTNFDAIQLAQLADTLRPRQNVPDTLTTPWLGLGKSYLDTLWQYYLENKPPLDLPSDKAWHAVVPLRYVLPVRIENPFGQDGPRCRVMVDGLLYPHGIAAVITLQIRFGQEAGADPKAGRGLALDGMMRRALEARSDLEFPLVMPDGTRQQLKLDRLGGALLDLMRETVLGKNVAQGTRATTPISVATIITATGWEGDAQIDEEPTLHRALEGLSTWKANWADVQTPGKFGDANLLLEKPSKGDGVYHSATGRAVWMPSHFQPGGKRHSLACYHRNLIQVTVQTEMLAQVCSMAAAYLDRNEPIPPTLEGLAKSAAIRLGLLFASQKSRKTITYNSASPRAFLKENNYVKDVDRVRKHFGMGELQWEKRSE